MRKLFYLFSGTLLAFVSCTNDYDASCLVKKNDPIKTDTIPVIAEPILLKKLVHDYGDGRLSTLNLSYNGTKILTDADDSNRTIYTYTGDVLTKIEKAELSGEVYFKNEYVYTNGKVDYILSNEVGSYYKIKYQYNTDGTISYNKLSSDSLGSEGGDAVTSGIYTFSNGNLIKEQSSIGSSESVTTYEYDAKKNPKFNILGSNLLMGIYQRPVNNLIKKVTQSNNAGNIFIETIIYSYEYNANGYPEKQTQTTIIGDKITTETSLYSY